MPRKTLSLLGFILVLSQLSGIPGSWKTMYAVFAGVVLMILSFKKLYTITSKVLAEETPSNNFKNAMSETVEPNYGENTEGK